MTTINLTRKDNFHEKKGLRVFIETINFDDVPLDTDIYELFKLPDNALVTLASILVLVASNEGTTAVVDLGIAGDDTLIDGGDLKATAGTNLSGGTNSVIPVSKATGGIVTFKGTYVGTAATVGSYQVRVEYIDTTRQEQGEQTNFSET